MRQEFTQQIEKTAQAVVNDIHTALPGQVVSFNAEKGTATVKPIGKFITSDNIVLAYPDIAEVPVVFPCSVNAGIAFPVMPGDNCLLIISEVELDEWRNGAEAEGSLKFDLTNAIAIPGLLNTGNGLISEAISKNGVVIASGNNKICVSGSGISVSGNLSVSGDISCAGEVKSGEIALKTHTHLSGEPGEKTSKPQ